MALASAAASASYKPRVVGIDGAAGVSAVTKDSSAGAVVTKRKDGRHVDAFRPTRTQERAEMCVAGCVLWLLLKGGSLFVQT